MLRYMNGDAVTAVDEAGRGLCALLKVVGVGPRLKWLWDAKLAFEGLPFVPFASVRARWLSLDVSPPCLCSC
jgi:hypothetical protein